MCRVFRSILLCSLICNFIILPALAKQTDRAVFESGNKNPVTEFINFDGTIDLDAIRLSGFEEAVAIIGGRRI